MQLGVPQETPLSLSSAGTLLKPPRTCTHTSGSMVVRDTSQRACFPRYWLGGRVPQSCEERTGKASSFKETSFASSCNRGNGHMLRSQVEPEPGVQSSRPRICPHSEGTRSQVMSCPAHPLQRNEGAEPDKKVLREKRATANAARTTTASPRVPLYGVEGPAAPSRPCPAPT